MGIHKIIEHMKETKGKGGGEKESKGKFYTFTEEMSLKY